MTSRNYDVPLLDCDCVSELCWGEGAGVLVLLLLPVSPADEPRRDGEGFFLSAHITSVHSLNL